MNKDKLIIAAAGSGKTTFLVKKAVGITDKKILVTTYTNANEKEIKNKLLELNGCIPSNVKIQTWFSFLLEHGVKPYQNHLTEKKVNGLLLVNKKSGLKYKGKFPVYYPEEEIDKHYFSKEYKIYSDKLSKFVIKCNKKSANQIIGRLEKICDYIFIDEVQDLAGYDLEIIKLLLKSKIRIMMVGDPRQVTYLTHSERKYDKYKEGKMCEFLSNECKKIQPKIDEVTLNNSFRCNDKICSYASKLFSDFTKTGSNQMCITGHDGVFFVKETDVDEYLEKNNPVILRDSRKKEVPIGYTVYNVGESKGLTFDRVLLYPTKPQIDWILGKSKAGVFKFKSRCKLYVALTRARYSVAIVYSFTDETDVTEIKRYMK